MPETRRGAISWTRPGVLFLCLSAPVAAACGGVEDERAGEAASTEEWTLAGPMAEIGVAEGQPEHQLHDVTDAVQLADGRIVLLDAGTAELRMFAGDGTFLVASGGRGDGPGEFRRPSRIHLTQPDSLLIQDPVLRRSSRFDTAGRFVWSEPWPASTDPFPGEVWLYGRHLVFGPRRSDLRGPVRRALDALPRPGPGGYRRVIVDEHWRMWVRAEPHDATESSLWTVWDLEADRLAHVRMPANLRPTQFGADFVVGVATDSMGVERVRVYALEGAPEDPRNITYTTTADDPEPEPAHEPPSDDAMRRMTDALRAIQAAQEVHYSRSAGSGSGYAGDIAALALDDAALESVEAHIMDGGPRGYTVLVFDLREPVGCGLTVGIGGPLGWTPGTALCR